MGVKLDRAALLYGRLEGDKTAYMWHLKLDKKHHVCPELNKTSHIEAFRIETRLLKKAIARFYHGVYDKTIKPIMAFESIAIGRALRNWMCTAYQEFKTGCDAAASWRPELNVYPAFVTDKTAIMGVLN
ncbi:hypothetical protein AVEN_192708-1 [Araneus ventricosus]|uniref:Uncharacterized protein n=1 Tax=Araneus ventricosus TaxID=182803 RepID=A0A4Y2UAL5_ARAVE|nr:hypothetical protein AVEN_192708-1 [Araneus ventricosus]